MDRIAELRIALLKNADLDKWTKEELTNELRVLFRDYVECQKALKNNLLRTKQLEALIGRR